MIGTCSRHYPPTRIEVTHLTRAKFIQRDKIFRQGQSREVERNWFDKLVYSLIYILYLHSVRLYYSGERREKEYTGFHALKSLWKVQRIGSVAGQRRRNGSCHVRDIHQRPLFQRSKRTCSISTLFLNPFWLSSDARTRADTWLDNCAHWCLPIDNPWKIYRTGCGQGSTAGDDFHCSPSDASRTGN